MNLRVLLITYNWPPRGAIGTLRAYGWAKYWARHGADVTVLTAVKQAYDHPLDLLLPAIPGVRVIETGPRQQQSLVAHAPPMLLRAAKRFKAAMRRSFGIVVDPRDHWIRHSIQHVRELSQGKDVVVSTFGPRSAHILGAAAKKAVPGTKWIADYRDLWSLNHLAGYGFAAKRREMVLELETMKGADAMTTVSEELAIALQGLHGRSAHVIPNGFDAEDVIHKTLEQPRSARITYAGMLYQGSRDPSPLFQAISELHDEGMLDPGSLTVDFYGPKDEWLAELVQRYQVADWVRLNGRIPRDRVLKEQLNSSMLLLLESGLPEAKGVLTGKLFEYLSMRRPIMSIGSSKDSAIARVLRQTGSGLVLENDVIAVKQEIARLVSGGHIDWYKPRLDEINAYSREAQALQVLSLVISRDQPQVSA